ncbi:MAG: hypothetical protein ACRD4B_09215 [Acidobacteriota bacterium]
MKILKLSGAAVLTLSLCFSYTFLFARSTDPKSAVSIKIKEELIALFPNEYEFLVFRDNPSHRESGMYVLEPMGELIHFDVAERHDIVAYPLEKKKYIALKGSGT